MATTEISTTIHGQAFSTSEKEYDSNEILATTASDRKVLDECWSAIVDRLGVWGLNPSVTDEDGLVSPSGESCSSACMLVIDMKDHGCSLPTGVIADGEGGIVFENKNDPIYQCVEIDEFGKMNLLTFKNGKLLSENPVEFIS